MKNILVKTLVLAAIFALPFTSTIASEAAANVALTSNYVFRGQTQSQDSAALQGSYDVKQSKNDMGWYAGAFASTVSKGLELDFYGGWKGGLTKQGNIGYDVGAILYKYTDSANTDITELYAGVNYETAYVKVYMGNGAGIANYSYVDVGASFVVAKEIDLNLHYGRMSLTSSNDISAILNTELKGFELALGLTYEDAAPNSDIEFFVTLTKLFDL